MKRFVEGEDRTQITNRDMAGFDFTRSEMHRAKLDGEMLFDYLVRQRRNA